MVSGGYMARDLSGLKLLRKKSELLSFLREEPKDRVLVYSSDLGPDDWEDGFALAKRTGDAVLIVRSMKAVGASNIHDFVNKIRTEGVTTGPQVGELAVVEKVDGAMPESILKMLRDVENDVEGCQLMFAGYEDIWFLCDF